jgi:hypothetical protein
MRVHRFAYVLGVVALGVAALGQLRVATYNVTNYSGGRVPEFQTAIYGVFQGRSMTPDIILGQEFLSSSALEAFRSLLNSAPGSPGDWATAPWVPGPDSVNVLFYRSSKVRLLRTILVAEGSGNAGNQPRNTMRYDVSPQGYVNVPATTLTLYNSHMKSGSTDQDMNRRLVEAVRIRDNAETLPAGQNFLLGADLNIQSSSQAAYQELVGSQVNNSGRFFDPISTPGNWNNSNQFRFVHTQDPIGTGGMDDRLDQILLSANLIDRDGFDYIGDPSRPYSTITWNDPNHSYRAWGNDGTSFNRTLTIENNQMVGATIAQALVTAAQSGGHLPVFLDLRVPPKIDSPTRIDLGSVRQGRPLNRNFFVRNAGDVALWTVNGIATLRYEMAATTNVTVPGGVFTSAAGSSNTHVVTVDTSRPGSQRGFIIVQSNAPEQPLREIEVAWNVVPPSRIAPVLR